MNDLLSARKRRLVPVIFLLLLLTLAALFELWPAPVPLMRDFSNQPLRYRLKADGSFVLYSVGEDAGDDRGDASPSEASATQRSHDSWSGRDGSSRKLQPPARA